MTLMQHPEYPLLVTYSDGTENESFDNEKEMVCTLEWFDSKDPEYFAVVTDKRGRRLWVVVRDLELVTMEIERVL